MRNISIFIIFLLLYCAPVVKTVFCNVSKPIIWKFNNESPPPADRITQSLEFIPNDTVQRLYVRVENVTEDFWLKLFAIPFKKSKFECPGAEKWMQDTNLRWNWYLINITASLPKTFNTSFPKIFTGCYYTVMINGRGENFLAKGPEFYKTNYTFLENRLIFEQDVKTIPKEGSNTQSLQIMITVPSKLIRVNARLFAWNQKILEEKNHLLRLKALEDGSSGKQFCKVEIVSEDKIIPVCDDPILVLKPILEVNPFVVTNDQWTAFFTWNNLSKQENTWYLNFQPDFEKWDDRGDQDVHYDRITWQGCSSDIHCELVADADNAPGSPRNDSHMMFAWIAIAVVIAMVAIVWIYGILKFRGSLITMRKKSQENERSIGIRLTAPFHDESESDQILLIYKKDDDSESPLSNEIDRLKCYLKTNCPSYQVHDIYTTNEWDRVSQLGVAGWSQDLLKNGSKIVWIDTPEFRSWVNDNQRECTVGADFRDDIISYAVSVALDSFQSHETQYRRHFVARVKGFQVEDGDKDPLQVVTPHARYYIPDQLPLLCERL